MSTSNPSPPPEPLLSSSAASISIWGDSEPLPVPDESPPDEPEPEPDEPLPLDPDPPDPEPELVDPGPEFSDPCPEFADPDPELSSSTAVPAEPGPELPSSEPDPERPLGPESSEPSPELGPLSSEPSPRSSAPPPGPRLDPLVPSTRALGARRRGDLRRRGLIRPRLADLAGLIRLPLVAPRVARPLDCHPGADRDRADRRDRGDLGRERGASARDRGASGRPGTGLDQQRHQRQGQDEADPVANGDPGPVDQLAHGALGRAEGSGDLLVGMALERAADERLALGVGEGGDHADDPVELLVGEHDLARLAHPVDLRRQLLVDACVAARVQRPVADDRVEPGLQMHISSRVAQCGPGAHEALLDHVLGIGGPVGGGEGDQAGAVAAHDLIERPLLATAGQRDEALVRLRVQDRSRERLESRLGHLLPLSLPGGGAAPSARNGGISAAGTTQPAPGSTAPRSRSSRFLLVSCAPPDLQPERAATITRA